VIPAVALERDVAVPTRIEPDRQVGQGILGELEACSGRPERDDRKKSDEQHRRARGNERAQSCSHIGVNVQRPTRGEQTTENGGPGPEQVAHDQDGCRCVHGEERRPERHDHAEDQVAVSAQKGNPERGRGEDDNGSVCDPTGQRHTTLRRISV
jgi:hypothetical protein